MRYLRLAFPVLVLLVCILGIVANYFNGNDAAFHANIVAACGWLIIAADEVLSFFDERKWNA